jgi:hypothetical protein
VALPDDKIDVEREITMAEGNVNHLVVEPIYSTKAEKRRPGVSLTSFKEGLISIRLTLNGLKI